MRGDTRSGFGSPPADGTSPRRRLLAVAGSARRRAVLSVLRGRDPLDERRLARRVAARERGVTVGSVPPGVHDRTRTALHHVDLPKLCAADLVERSGDGLALGGVRPREIRTIVDAIDATGSHGRGHPPDSAGRGGPEWEAIEALCRDPTREVVVSTLAAAGALSVGTLAARIVARGTDATPAAVPDRVVAAERVALRQVHLPVLSSADVLAYDAEAGRVCEPRVPPLYARLYAGR